MTHVPLKGLLAAALTPFNADGTVSLKTIEPIVELLIRNGVSGLYVCGSTGEGISLSTSERKDVLEEYIRAVNGRIRIIAQVGHNSLVESRDLAKHAAKAGADMISATCPSYFKASDTESLAECVTTIASAAPETPFYYYHIPALTSSPIDIVSFMETASRQIPNLVGLKYTDPKLFEYQACMAINDGALDIIWGVDEMLLGAVATGGKAAIGSTYNITAPLSLRVMQSFADGDIKAAREHQLQSALFIRELLRYPFHAAVKFVMAQQGVDPGPVRAPLKNLTDEQKISLAEMLKRVDADSFVCR